MLQGQFTFMVEKILEVKAIYVSSSEVERVPIFSKKGVLDNVKYEFWWCWDVLGFPM